MNRILRSAFVLIWIMVPLQGDDYLPDFDVDAHLKNEANDNSFDYQKAVDTSSSEFYQVKIGNADTLLQAMGENSEELKERQGGWGYKNYWYWDYDPTQKIIGEKNCDSNGSNCTPVYQPTFTQKELQAKEQEAVKKACDYYKESKEKIDQMPFDIKALQEKIAILNTRQLGDQTGKNLKTTLERLLRAAKKAHSLLMQHIKNKERENILHQYLPSKSDVMLAESLQELNDKIKFASSDPKMQAMYQEVKQHLLRIQKVVDKLKNNHESLSEAKTAAEKDKAKLEKIKTTHGRLTKEQQDEIKKYDEVISELDLEIAHENKVEKERGGIEVEAQIMIDTTYYHLSNDEQSINFALESAQADLEKEQAALQKTTMMTRKDALNKKIKVLQVVIELLEKEKSEVTQVSAAVQKRAQDLLLKHGGDVKKALEAAFEQEKKMITADTIAIRKLLEERKEAEEKYLKENDPVQKAVVELKNALPLDKFKALLNLGAALLGKAGVKVDELSIPLREQFALIVKTSSDQLLGIIQNQRLTDMQKNLQQQEIVKNLSFDITALVTAAKTGARFEDVRTAHEHGLVGGSLQVGVSILSNNLLNALLPADAAPLPSYDPSKVGGAQGQDPKAAAYKTLGLYQGASQAEIKKAYHQLALQYHPDKNFTNPGAAAKFQDMSNAYQLLTA